MKATMRALRRLLLQELNDLYSAETQVIKVWPAFASAASDPLVARAFNENLIAGRQHMKRLEEVFSILGEKPDGEVCAGMQGLLAEGSKLLNKNAEIDPAVLDAALLGAAQRVEHYEMAGYGCAQSYAQQLGEIDCASLLQQTLDEEGETDRLLTELALSRINTQAEAAASAL